jgi:hypothetical protein
MQHRVQRPVAAGVEPVAYVHASVEPHRVGAGRWRHAMEEPARRRQGAYGPVPTGALTLRLQTARLGSIQQVRDIKIAESSKAAVTLASLLVRA